VCPSPNIIRARKSGRIKWAENLAGMEIMRSTYDVSAGKSEGKRPYGEPRH
jgi:hypothetical protein